MLMRFAASEHPASNCLIRHMLWMNTGERKCYTHILLQLRLQY